MPTGADFINELVDRGNKVDVLTFENPAHPQYVNTLNKCSVYFSTVKNNDCSKLKSIFIDIPFILKHLVKNNHYDAVIALSQLGLIYAWYYCSKSQNIIIYLADEIKLGLEGRNILTNIYYRLLKMLEIRANRSAKFSITQDSDRAVLLAKQNHIPINSIMLLPNTRRGKAKRTPSNYLADMFGLQKNKLVILNAGMISIFNKSFELTSASLRWPMEYVLVFHNRYDQKGEQEYLRIKAVADPKRVLFTNKPVSFEELDMLISSAYIGIALYADSSENLTNMGLSSGKISSYMKNGIPVIAQRFDSLHWIEDSKAGILVSHANEILNAIQLIKENYNAYCMAALKIFDEKLSFDSAFEPILHKLEKDAYFGIVKV
jgi:hypothetical protein